MTREEYKDIRIIYSCALTWYIEAERTAVRFSSYFY